MSPVARGDRDTTLSPSGSAGRILTGHGPTYRNTPGDSQTTPGHHSNRTELSTKHPPDIPFLMSSTVSPGLSTTTAGWRGSRWWRTSWWSTAAAWWLALLSSLTFQQSRGMIGGAASISAYKVGGGEAHLSSSRQASRQSSSLMSSSLPSGQSVTLTPSHSKLTLTSDFIT